MVETIITAYTFDDDISKPLEESQLKSEIELWKEKSKNWRYFTHQYDYILTFYYQIITLIL